MKELLQLETIVKKISTLSDGGLKLEIITQELKPEDATKLFRLKGKIGFMVFKPAKITEEDIINLPEEIKEFKSDKTPSQKLRAVIYLTWKQTSQKETFDQFYRRHIGKLVEQYKEKL